MVEKRFRVLRIIGTIYKILGWVILVLGILTSLGIFVGGLVGGAGMTRFMMRSSQLSGLMGGVLGGLVVALISFILTLVYFVFVYGMGELIYLFLAIEENTRVTSAWIGQRLPAPGAPPVPPQ